MRIIIMGCGRVGSALAVQLTAEGHDARVIDRDPKSRRLFRPTSPASSMSATATTAPC